MQKIFTIGLLSFFLWACGGKDTQKKTLVSAEPTVDNKPTNVSGLPPIYENFDILAPIFNQKNDTTYVINFWATWCAPCVKELPYFEALNQKYLDKKVKVILVNLDFKKQLEKKLKPFLKEHNLQSQVLILTDPDANSWVDKVNPKWSGAIPATVVYKGNKNKFYEQSFDDLVSIEKIIEPFL